MILHECSCFIEFIKPVGEKDKMRGLSTILSLFRKEFYKFNNTGAQMLDSMYHRTLKLRKKCIFENTTILPSLRTVIMVVIM